MELGGLRNFEGLRDERATAVLTYLLTVPTAGSAVVLVPAQDPAPPPGQGPEFGNASPVGLVVVLLLLIATVLLIRSMAGRIRRLPESFDPSEDREGSEGPAGSDDDGPDRSEGGDGHGVGRPSATEPERPGPG